MLDYISILKNGGVGVMPTDTLYGLTASATNKTAVERVYRVKGRQPSKPSIILIDKIERLGKFGIELDQAMRTVLDKVWPGPVSVIFTPALSFRLPANKELRGIITQTGPLIAPSANPEGAPPAKTIAEAQKYFGDTVDFYLDGGELGGEPSTLIKINNGKIEVIRDGVWKEYGKFK